MKSLNFEDLNVKYVAKDKSRDYLSVEAEISPDRSEYLEETEEFNIGKTRRFITDGEIDEDALLEKVEQLIEDRIEMNIHREKDSGQRYRRNSGDAGMEEAKKIDGVDVEKADRR